MFDVRDDVTRRYTITADLESARMRARTIVENSFSHTATILGGTTGHEIERWFRNYDGSICSMRMS